MTSGEAVPIASKGIFTFDESAVEYVNSSDGASGTAAADGTDSDWAVSGGQNAIATQGASGKIILTSNAGSARIVGSVLGTGKRTAQSGTDQFAGAKGESTHYVVVKLDL